MRPLLSASRDETLQLNMQTCQSGCPTMRGTACACSTETRGRLSSCVLHRIALPPLASWRPDHMRNPAATAHKKNGPHRPRNRPGYRNISRNAGGHSRALGETHTIHNVEALSLVHPGPPLSCGSPSLSHSLFTAATATSEEAEPCDRTIYDRCRFRPGGTFPRPNIHSSIFLSDRSLHPHQRIHPGGCMVV